MPLAVQDYHRHPQYPDVLTAKEQGIDLVWFPWISVNAPKGTPPAIIKKLRVAFEGRVPLIGFGGAPFTLACYMVEGQGSKDFASLKQIMYSDFPLYDALMKKVTEMDRRYLNMQIEAGAQAIQIFDTWGGLLAPHDFEKYILPYVKELIDGLNRDGIPIIYFVKNGGTMLELVPPA